jgi:hypothetical protein
MEPNLGWQVAAPGVRWRENVRGSEARLIGEEKRSGILPPATWGCHLPPENDPVSQKVGA